VDADQPADPHGVELIAQGEIGEVVATRAEFGLGRPFDPGHRLYDSGNGGGALLDLGIYPITFAYLFLGRPDQVLTRGTLAPTGVDDIVAMEWIYAGVLRAQTVVLGLHPRRPTSRRYWGRPADRRQGATHRPTALVVHAGRSSTGSKTPSRTSTEYGPEIAEVERCLRAGLARARSSLRPTRSPSWS